jgi:hypothetical protein
MLADQRTQFLHNIDVTYGANSAIAIYARSLYAVPSKVTTQIRADTGQATLALANTQAQLAALQGTYYIKIAVATPNVPGGFVVQPGAAHARASGGYLQPGTTIVDEQGPEAVSWIPGSPPYVHSASQTRALGTGHTTVYNINVNAMPGNERATGQAVIRALEIYTGKKVNVN